MQMPKIDDEELLLFLSHTGPKNLENFKTQACISKLKRKYEGLISNNPVVAYTYLGVIEAYNNRNDEALRLLHVALKLAPNELVILHNIAKTYEQAGDFNSAIDYFFKALSLAPNDADMFRNAYTLAEFFCNTDVLNKLEQINTSLYRAFPESPVLKLIEFLSGRAFDFNNYEAQISCCFKAIHKILNLHSNEMVRYFNFEGNYLVNFVEFDLHDVDVIEKINKAYENEIYLFASQQDDGGFDFYDKLNQSCISFTMMNQDN